MAQRQPFFDFFLIFAKTVHTIRTNFCSPSTLYYGPLCAISSNLYRRDVRNIAKINPKMAKKTAIFRRF